ncbi:MAG: HEPN domain-containing protein [Candidatus Lokiarchaeota archaeon]
MDRSEDWLKQGKTDLKAANHLLQMGDFSWSCFLAQQTAEKCIKALGERKNIVLWGHDLVDLFEELKKKVNIPDQIINTCKTLNLYYISTRDPDAFPSGYPSEKFSKQQAQEAIKLANEVLEYVQNEIS